MFNKNVASHNDNVFKAMHPPFTQEKETEIAAAVEADPHASRTARRLGVSDAAVWRIAYREVIDLAAGRAAKGRKRVSAEHRAAVLAAGQANPQATQAEIARVVGISRVSVSRIEGGRRRRGVRGLQPG